MQLGDKGEMPACISVHLVWLWNAFSTACGLGTALNQAAADMCG